MQQIRKRRVLNIILATDGYYLWVLYCLVLSALLLALLSVTSLYPPEVSTMSLCTHTFRKVYVCFLIPTHTHTRTLCVCVKNTRTHSWEGVYVLVCVPKFVRWRIGDIHVRIPTQVHEFVVENTHPQQVKPTQSHASGFRCVCYLCTIVQMSVHTSTYTPL